MLFGDKLRRLREQTGKSQTEVVAEIRLMFGKEARISQSKLSTLEKRYSAPRGEVLDVLSKYYNVPVTYFSQPEEMDEDARRRPGIELAKDYLRQLRLYAPGDPKRWEIKPKVDRDDWFEEDMDW